MLTQKVKQVPTFFFIVYNIFFDICKRKNGQKQVKKKAFKINAKIEDVGLNEDKKKYGKKLNFDDQPKSQNPTYCFFSFFKSELSVSSWSIPALTTIKENNSSYLCTDQLECSKHFLQCRISG